MTPKKPNSPLKTEKDVQQNGHPTRGVNDVKRLQRYEKRCRFNNRQALAIFSIHNSYTEKLLFGKERQRLRSMTSILSKLQPEQPQQLNCEDHQGSCQVETAMVQLKTLRALKMFFEADREGIRVAYISA